MKGKLIISLLLIGLIFTLSAGAEKIILKSGKTFEGKVSEKTNEYIKIDFHGVPLIYYFEEIETIDGVKVYSSSRSKDLFPLGWERWYFSVKTFMDKVGDIEDKATQILNKNDKILERAMKDNDYIAGERILEETIAECTAIIEEFKVLDIPQEFGKYIDRNIESYKYRKLYYEATLKYDRDLAFQSYSKALRTKLEAIEESKRVFIQHQAPKEMLNFIDGEIRYYKTLFDEFSKRGFRN